MVIQYQLSVYTLTGRTGWAWNHGICIRGMPGVSRFECSIVFSTSSCAVSSRCWYMLSLWTKQSDHEYRRETWPTSSYVSADPPPHLFLFSSTIPCKILTVPVVSIFTVPVVPRTLLGTDGFSGSAPAATNGGHQKALTSRSFCKAEIMLISCVQIKMKPVEMYHPLVSWETE